MSKKIYGVTVGTPISPKKIENEIKPVKSVNGVTPDVNGNVAVKIPSTPTKVSQLENDSGYITKAGLPATLPNPKALTIDGQSYDGSAAVKVYTGSGKSVLAYGAKGDGSTDDTVAFRTALSENRVVYVPGGSYALSDTLVIRENCCLELSQDTVLKFMQTDKNCIHMQRSAAIRGNHATMIVPYTYSAHVIHAGTDVEDGTPGDVPPWTRWDPMWKMTRYITDLNICKPDSRGFHYSVNGDCYGTAVHIYCERATAQTYNGEQSFMWGVEMHGLRIAGGFSYGIHAVNEINGASSYAWNHDMRLDAVIIGCEVGVKLDHCHCGFISAIVQPSPAYSMSEVYKPYAKYGIQLVDSQNVDLSGSRVWDWMNEGTTLWEDGGEYQHLALYGNCKGLILSDFLYYDNSALDIRSLIYTDTPSNFENMTILQEPITRWFKGKDRLPHYFDGTADMELVMKKDYFNTKRVQNYTDLLALATDADGNVFNGVGYKLGAYVDGAGNYYDSGYGWYTTTGFIPISPGDVVHMRGISFDFALKAAQGEPDASIKAVYFDANKNYVFHNSCGIIMAGAYYQSGERTDDGMKITLHSTLSEKNAAYVRFVFHRYDMTNDPIIAINEEIKFLEEGFLVDSVKVKANNMYLYSPSGKTFQLTISDDGVLTPVEVTV